MPPLVLIAGAWALGLVLAHHALVPAGVEPGALLIVAGVPLAALGLWRRDRSMRLAAVCALVFIGGALRYQIDVPARDDPSRVAYYDDRGWATVEGVVCRYPDTRDTWTNVRLAAEYVEIGDQRHPVHGLVLVRAPRVPEVHYGDRLRVAGRLETPPVLEDFDYREYLARKGIFAYVGWPRVEVVAHGQGHPIQAMLFAVKDRAREAIARLVPEPEASLMQGILLGSRGGIPRTLYDQFNATGTSHLIVISGSNITLVIALFWAGMGELVGRRRAYWLTIAGIAAYVAFVGGEAAVMRAGLMGALFVTALYIGRRATAYVSLCASGLLLTVLSPMVLWDPGFQLSFAATLSLILFTPPIQRPIGRRLCRVLRRERVDGVAGAAVNTLVATLAAQVLTLPLVLIHFGRLSAVAPLANVLVLPVQPAIMTVGMVGTALAIIPGLASAAQVVLWVPWLCLAYTTAVVRWLAGWPLASIAVSPGRAERLAVFYGLALIAVWLARKPRVRQAWQGLIARPGRRVTVGLLAPPLVLALLAWIAAWQQPDGRLHVVFLDVGEGDAILITTPAGQQILVDGGPSPTALAGALGRHMPFWDRSIDRVIMTHADADHLTGLLDVLRRYEVGGWLEGGEQADTTLYRESARLMDGKGVDRQAIAAGDVLDMGRGASLVVLSPSGQDGPARSGEESGNGRSVVLRLSWGQAGVLLTGDAGADVEQALAGSGAARLRAQVLKVAHHGSDASSSPAFLAAVAPRYAVISVGADNRFGHPAPAVLERLAEAGATVLRTDELGTIELVTDGRQWWLKTER